MREYKINEDDLCQIYEKSDEDVKEVLRRLYPDTFKMEIHERALKEVEYYIEKFELLIKNEVGIYRSQKETHEAIIEAEKELEIWKHIKNVLIITS